MTSKWKRTIAIFSIVLIALFALAMYAYREYHRTARDTADIEAIATITASRLIEDFSNADSVATKKYLGKALIVSGNVNAIDSNAAAYGITIIIGEQGGSSAIRCNIEKADQPFVLPAVNSSISIKGICNGYLPDEMGLGADVILDRCVIMK